MFKRHRYHAATDNFRAHIHSLRISIAVLAAVCIALLALIASHNSTVRLSLPPVLDYGAELTGGEIQPWEVFAFAGTIHQQLNTWHVDGKQGFPRNLERLRYFFTPQAVAYYTQRVRALDAAGELSGRRRYILPAESYREELVEIHDARRWTVTLRYYLHERVEGLDIKDGVLLEVVLPIFYDNLDPIYNYWGLWIDAPTRPARRIREQA